MNELIKILLALGIQQDRRRVNQISKREQPVLSFGIVKEVIPSETGVPGETIYVFNVEFQGGRKLISRIISHYSPASVEGDGSAVDDQNEFLFIPKENDTVLLFYDVTGELTILGSIESL